MISQTDPLFKIKASRGLAYPKFDVPEIQFSNCITNINCFETNLLKRRPPFQFYHCAKKKSFSTFWVRTARFGPEEVIILPKTSVVWCQCYIRMVSCSENPNNHLWILKLPSLILKFSKRPLHAKKTSSSFLDRASKFGSPRQNDLLL